MAEPPMIPRFGPWKYDKRIVAFVDILGYKALMALPEHELAKLAAVISSELSEHRFDRNMNWFVGSGRMSFSARSFSDCIYLSDEWTEEGCKTVITQAAKLAQSLAIYGIYVRGGITDGRHYENPAMIFGEGIVNAYMLESQIAKNPRIIISAALHSTFNLGTCQLVFKDEDGEFCVDYWEFSIENYDLWDWESQSLSNEEKYIRKKGRFELAKKQLENNIAAADTDKTKDKLKWLAIYHNRKVEALIEVTDRPQLNIDLSM